MRFNGPNAVNLVWATFGEAHLLMVLWFALLMKIHELCLKGWERMKVSISSSRGDFPPLPDRRELSVAALGMVAFALFHSFYISPWNNTFKNDERYIPSRIATSMDSYDAAQRAREYFDKQVGHIQHSINSRFTLHPYFSHTVVRKNMRLEQVVNQRLNSFEMQLEKYNTRGFMIEKDKCAMLEFFQDHDIHVPKIIGIYHDKKKAHEKLKAIQSESASYNYPLFLKGCHLTQGGDKGTVAVRMENFTRNGAMERYMLPWIDTKWEQKPLDNNRPWSKTMNKLLATLEPGIAIQGPFRGLRISPENTPLEAKVEVVWGRAYLGLFPEYHDIIALRGGVFEYTRREKGTPEHWTLGNKEDTRLRWLVDGGHMESVWALAEKVARRIGIDEIRVDIFIDPERPEAPAVNEISLSSAHNYLFHSPYLARAWIGPHLKRQLKASGRESGDEEVRMWNAPKIRATTKDVHLQTLAAS
mmetsp:Transcript_31953/g.54122  ORF Transcript_31953/g.54122 Transcript_31953/m.54122 type:complete len:472 (-) Transcript_31953:77-1492(-)